MHGFIERNIQISNREFTQKIALLGDFKPFLGDGVGLLRYFQLPLLLVKSQGLQINFLFKSNLLLFYGDFHQFAVGLGQFDLGLSVAPILQGNVDIILIKDYCVVFFR